MKFIATDVTDSPAKLAEMVTEQLKKPGFAIDPYFYRSHVTYQWELEQVFIRAGFMRATLAKFQIRATIFCSRSARILSS